MSKAVVYALLATAFFIFLVLSPNSRQDDARLIPGRRLGYKFRVPAFDPLVIRIERSVEERKSGSDHRINNAINQEDISYIPEVEDSLEYFSDEGILNITLRLITMFPLLDVSPVNGLVSYDELETWNIQQALDRLYYRTQKEITSRDKNGDGAISFSEYLPQFTEEDIDKREMGHGEAGWWMKQFNNADVDWDGSLNFNEFNDFLHPEDSNNEKIHMWLLSEKMKRMDDDHDMKLNFQEFLHHAYDIHRSYLAFETDGNVPTAEEKFTELDLNKDRFIDVEELKPILRYLYPGELSHAKYYTSYLIHEADDNKDGALSLAEMLNHENLFYNTLYDDGLEDYDEFHDEL
ncbi:hypothetical protein SLE2022_374280 [Rubroshorea leprosula]